MSNGWKIKKHKDVHGGANGVDLIGCEIVENATNTAYQFEDQDSVVRATAGPPLPTVPFQFPMFNAELGGSSPQNWYITVCTLTGGNSNNQAGGTWNNSAFQACEGVTGDDPDTWVAQAGTSPEEEEEASAASA
jgi:hypothetical protein